MEQGYQTFKQYYIEPIKKVSEMISHTAVRSVGSAARGVAHETLRGVKTVGREVYNYTIKGEYQLWQAKRRKKAELNLEMKYSQKRCDNYVVRFKTEISPKLISAGIPPETCDRIKKQWISLASPDLNPFESIIDYGTLQKGYEIFTSALLSGKKSVIRDSVKNWDRLYEARESMRGSERMYYERAKKNMHREKDEKTDKSSSKESSKGADNKTGSRSSGTKETSRSAGADADHTKTYEKRKSKRNITPEEAKEMGSKAVTFRDGIYMRNVDEYVKSHGVNMPKNTGERSVREAAVKAGEQLKREESKAAERTNKSINKAISSLGR